MNDSKISYFKQYIPLIMVLLCFFVLYHQVIYKMVLDWTMDDNYSHGFLIPLISGYLIWCKKDMLSESSINPSNLGLILLTVSLAFFIITNLGAELFTMRFSMIMVILSSLVFLAGWKFTGALFLPVVYLIFMIPLPAIIWNKMAFPLKLFATKIAVGVINFLSIPVYREGNIIHLANTTLEVVDACSGLRSLTSLLALSAAFALISEHSSIKKFILFLSAIPIAIFVNIVRLSGTAVLARYFGAQVAQGFLHEVSGILVFVFAFVILYIVHWFLLKFNPK
jgi:exosortase A